MIVLGLLPIVFRRTMARWSAEIRHDFRRPTSGVILGLGLVILGVIGLLFIHD
jgi:hypothetical protein